MRARSEIGPVEQKYLKDAMGKVSRSFAVVVAHLEQPLSFYMATAYLICRVIDNIEDSFLPAPLKQQRFHEFNQLLDDPALAPDILAQWQTAAWPGLTQDEQRLMGDGATGGSRQLWQIYATLPAHARSTIAYWTQQMAQGMEQLDNPHRSPYFVEHDKFRLLATEEDYNRYCYYVAGTVGFLGTELVIEHYQLPPSMAARLRDSCEACGRGLQKTNIVKDFVEDRERQICYLPATWLQETDYAPLNLVGAPTSWKQKVLNDVVQELHQSLDHVLSVPQTATGYRMASLLCLLPALHTIQLAAQRQASLFTSDHHVKIGRPTMLQCIQSVQSLWNDDEAIVAQCRKLEDAVATEFMLPVAVKTA